MQKHIVCFPEFAREQEVAENQTVLEAMIAAGIRVDAPCGGRGSCGKCTVELRRAGTSGWERVRACQTRVDADLEVRVPTGADALRVLTQGAQRAEAAWTPRVRAVRLDAAQLLAGEDCSVWARFSQALEAATCASGWRCTPSLVRRLVEMLRSKPGELLAVAGEGEVLDIADSAPAVCMAAFDLGTTSIAGYLLDVQQQRCVATVGEINPQIQFGADVISRIDYAMEHGTEALSSCVREALNRLTGRLCERAGIDRAQVYAASLVGNTGMHHLFLNIPPDTLARAPYLPAMEEGLRLRARDYGLEMHPNAELIVLPVIAGYVGADTVACLLSGNWLERETRTLMVDIGTNGELVMGNRQRKVACSTAAGPAFEGARIQCGMRGVDGAVDRVWLEDGCIRWHVIGEGEAKGLCGSGLVDLIAVLLKTGAIDESGRLAEGEGFRLGDTQVVLTQRDVREVQLAKAAISAGIQLMAEKLDMALTDIEEVDIAGAFGNYLNADSACDIGLIPDVLRTRIRKVGNAAGEGAKLALQYSGCWQDARRLAEETEFLELASIPVFQDTFVDALDFPDMEVDGDEL